MRYGKRQRKPVSLAETMRANQAALNYYSRLSGKPLGNLAISVPGPKKRVPGRGSAPKEHAEQVEYVNWFRRTYPTVLIFAIPNGGLRDPVTAAKLKREGVEPDVPDLFVPKFRLWVEMKRIGGARRASQREMAEHLIGCGYLHFFGMGAEDAKQKTMQLFPVDDYATSQTL